MNVFREWVAAPFAAKKKAAAMNGAAEEIDMLNMQNEAEEIKAVNGGGKRIATFISRLEYLIKAGSDPKRMVITPSQADAILEKWNTRNRPLTKSKWRKYESAMKAGRWQFTGEPIIFSAKRLIDGQHRLAACAASGVMIDVLLVFGAPDEAFPFIDVGWTRTAGDIFSINGVKYATVAASAINFVVEYEQGRISNAAKSVRSLDHGELYDEYLKRKGIEQSFWVADAFRKERLAPPSLMTAVHYLCAKKNRQQADDFFQRVADGLNLTNKKDPAYRLRSRLIDNSTTQEKMGRKLIAALAIKAWNAHRLNRDVGTLKFSPDEAFPRVI